MYFSSRRCGSLLRVVTSKRSPYVSTTRYSSSSSALIDPSISHIVPDIVKIRHDLHKHPELGFEESRTSGKVASYLEEWGVEVKKGVGLTGIVGTLHGTGAKSASSINSLGFRADMDGLPMQEHNTFEYKSQHPNLFHGCGHDGHTSVLLGLARVWAAQRDKFCGKIHFIFQPAEENGPGAEKMIEDGLFEGDLSCDEVYAYHNWPYLERGKISVRDGPIMASSDEFDIVIHGHGTHAAFPHLGVDPILTTANVVNSLQSITSRGSDPFKAQVISVTKFQSGSAYNVIPDTARISGTVRTLCDKDRQLISKQIHEMVDSIARAHGSSATVDYVYGYPATVNVTDQTKIAKEAAELTVGKDNVVEELPTLGAEDFSYMLKKCGKGCFVWIGAESAGKLHENNYDFDDATIDIAIQYFSNIIKLRLGSSA